MSVTSVARHAENAPHKPCATTPGSGDTYQPASAKRSRQSSHRNKERLSFHIPLIGLGIALYAAMCIGFTGSMMSR
jgi:hypothetical protein